MKLKKYLSFLGIAYATALFFEILAHFIDPLNKTFDQAWPVTLVFFIVWYGIIYSITFFIFKKQKAYIPAIVWAILGLIAEIIIFKRQNLIIDPIIYTLMFYIPFKIYRKFFLSQKR